MGDAQARAGIYNFAKQTGRSIYNASAQFGDYVGSKLPVGKPGNSGYGQPKSTWRPPGMVPDMSGTSGTGAVKSGPAAPSTGQVIQDAAAQVGSYVGSKLPTPSASYAYGSGPASASAQAAGAVAAPAAVTNPATSPTLWGSAGAGPGGAPPPAATQPPIVKTENPLNQSIPGRDIERLPDGSLDTSTLIDTPQSAGTAAPTAAPAATPQAPAPAAGNSPQAWGSAGSGPGGSPGQETKPPQQQPQQQQQPTQTNFQKLHESTVGTLNDQKATPEAKQQAMRGLMDEHVKANPALAQGLKDKLAGNNTPASAEFDKSFETAAGDEVDKAYREWKAVNPNSTPQQDGSFIGNMWNQIQNMPPEAQGALALGIPLAVLGVGMTAFGGGGLGSLLMSVLGLGAVGAGAASMGAFGQDAQNTVTGAIGGLGKMFAPMLGVNLPDEADIRARLTEAGKQGPDAAAAELAKVREEVGPYARYSPEARQFMEQSADPNFMYNQARGYTEQNFDQILDQELQDPSKRDFRGWLANSLGMDSAAAKQDGSWAQDGNWFFSGYGAPGSPQRQKFIEDQMARKGWEMVKQQCVNTMRKAARCWAGYEPVPGAKAYSEGSCRPKGSKKTKKEVIQGKKRTEKKAAGPARKPYSGPYSQSPYNHAHMLQTLKLPPNTSPEMAYNRAIHLWQNNRLSSAQSSALMKEYGGLPPAFEVTTNSNQTPAPAVPGTTAPSQPQPSVSPFSTQPATPGSPAPAPKRPTMTQMPSNTAAASKQPSPQQVAYSAWQKSQKPPIKPQPTATPTANTAKVPGNQFLQPTR
jgi:hypothetical protein